MWMVRGGRWEIRIERWEVRCERWELRVERWEVKSGRWEVRGVGNGEGQSGCVRWGDCGEVVGLWGGGRREGYGSLLKWKMQDGMCRIYSGFCTGQSGIFNPRQRGGRGREINDVVGFPGTSRCFYILLFGTGYLCLQRSRDKRKQQTPLIV